MIGETWTCQVLHYNDLLVVGDTEGIIVVGAGLWKLGEVTAGGLYSSHLWRMPES